MDRFEVYEDSEGQWRYRVKGGNGEIVAVSEGYTRKADAERGLETLSAIVAGGSEEVSVTAGVESKAKHLRREPDGGLARATIPRMQELIAAAWCYLSAAHRGNGYDLRMVPMDWPWRREDWKPGTKLENLEKAESILREVIAMSRPSDK